MIKNTKHAITDKFDELIEECPQDKYDYTIVQFDCKASTYDYIYEKINDKLKDGLITGIIPINVCAHCGPGTIGLVVSPKINNKSIKDFM